MLGLRHRLRTACHDEGGGSGPHLHRRLEHRLQPGPAASVHLEARNPGAQASVQGRDPAQSRSLTIGVALAQDHVVDVALTETGARGQGP